MPLIIMCLSLNGSMPRDQFVIYPQGLQEAVDEYLAVYEEAISAEDGSGLTRLFELHGAEAQFVHLDSIGKADIRDWIRLLAHDPQAMGIAWGVSEAIMYAELTALLTENLDHVGYDLRNVVESHSNLAFYLTEGMHHSVNDRLADADEYQRIAIPAAQEAIAIVLDLLSIGLGSEMVPCGIEYLAEWDGGDFEKVSDRIGSERWEPEGALRAAGDLVGRQIFDLLARHGGLDDETMTETAATYASNYTDFLSYYR
ncbi:hypothetical protein AB0B28_05585 [Glycomyces sp. NPDC046736]|uniref:hypothetical protein n=1 Tax=Glycomyces sp. NPDC046736 TaxID=3155615 RepID=UPI0033C3F219